MEQNVCRICLNKTATASVFDVYDGIQYCTKIMRCVNIIISEDDGLPHSICDRCLSELSITYEFVQKCEASDKALRCLGTTDICEDVKKIVIDIKEETVPEDDIKSEPNDEDSYDGQYTPDNLKEDSDDEQSICKFESQKRLRKKYERRNRRSRTGPIQCAHCGQMVISQSALETHMRTHTGEKPFSCQTCNSRFPTKGSLKRHTETYHMKRERKFTCETCGSSFYRKNDIITHIRTHTDERPYVCPFCSKRFRQVASLIRHKRIHTGEKPYSCPICDKKFSDANLVKKHQLVHSDERKFTCHLCSKSVKSKTALNTHLTIHSNEKRNICSFCGMAFSMKGNLQTHIRRVHSEKSGQCTVCLKTFSDLEVHMRKHTGEKPFVCALCSQAFATKRSLAHHMVFKHQNAAKYKCSIGECTKTFPTSMMLEFHLLKQHTNHTPYVCPHCSRGFFRTSDLSRHLRVSHMDIQIKTSMKTVDT